MPTELILDPLEGRLRARVDHAEREGALPIAASLPLRGRPDRRVPGPRERDADGVGRRPAGAIEPARAPVGPNGSTS